MKLQRSVTLWVDVTVDESKFTEAFLEEFREQFFNLQTVEEHVDHLAYLFATGQADEDSTFIEGYGNPAEFGIRFEFINHDVNAA